MKRVTIVGFACSLLTAIVAPARAHHSAANFDTKQSVTVKGRIVEYSYKNPHIYIVLQVTRDDGPKANMEVEAGSAAVLNGLGLTRTAISVGDLVTIVGNPARTNPEKLMLGLDLYKQDGNYVPLNTGSRSIYDAKNSKPA